MCLACSVRHVRACKSCLPSCTRPCASVRAARLPERKRNLSAGGVEHETFIAPIKMKRKLGVRQSTAEKLGKTARVSSASDAHFSAGSCRRARAYVSAQNVESTVSEPSTRNVSSSSQNRGRGERVSAKGQRPGVDGSLAADQVAPSARPSVSARRARQSLGRSRKPSL